MPPKGKGKGKPKASEADDTGDKSNGGLKVANSLKLRHILCEKQSKHLEALAKLQEPGAKFDVVATAYSEDKARHGGSLGWMVRSAMNGEFQAHAFSIPVSNCAAPIYKTIKTKHGYHILMIEDRK